MGKGKTAPYVSAVIVAAGKGKRMGSDRNKLLLPIFGKSVLSFTLAAFEECSTVDEIIIVAGEEDMPDFYDIVRDRGISKVKSIVRGGKERQDSVFAGLSEVSEKASIVAIHDGARALITPDLITLCIKEAEEKGAVAAAVPVKDTLKEVNEEGIVECTPQREKLWAVQTPQVFKKEIIKNAHSLAREEGFLGTDDCSLVERMGKNVHLIMGSYENIKLTTKEDMLFAQAILEERSNF